MCSIIGYYKLDKESSVKKNFIKDGLSLMRHRGPDAEGVKYYFDKKVGLGNQRLSIVDVKTGANQPMETKKSVVVYNGEIYNYIELKERLKTKKTKFESESDTEVLLKGLEQEGTKFLNTTNGMFSFAQFNFKSKTLVIGRDRFGVKPVYYLVEDGVLYFSSEMKPLIRIKKQKKRNTGYYKKFFEDTATDYDENTFIKGIYQVKAGHLLVVEENGNFKQQKWYFGRDFKVNSKVFENEVETIDYVEDLLTDALRIRIRADVPASISLSGGLDSSVLYVLAKERLKTDLTTFSLFDSAPELSEKEKIMKLITVYGDKVNSFTYSRKRVLKDLQRCLYTTEFPIWDPSVVVYDELYKKIHKAGYKMVIEGHGSDEVLGGYSYMVEEAIKEHIKKGKILASVRLLRDNLQMNVYSGKQNIVKKFGYLYLQSWDRKNYGFEKTLENAFNYKILPIVLRTFDRLSMANSLENRNPFLDYRVVETFKKLPTKYKISDIGSKSILRLILRKYGKDFIYKDKRKIGFGVKTEELLNRSMEVKKFFKENIEVFDIEEFSELRNEARVVIEKEKITSADIALLWKIASVGYIDRQIFTNYE